MLKCSNCGQKSEKTEDFTCQRCGSPLIPRVHIWKSWDAIVYLAAIILAEVVAVFFDPLWGIIGHIVILAAVIVYSSMIGQQTRQRIFLSFALVPLVRIIGWCMPLVNIPMIWWYPIIYVPLAVAAFVLMRVLGYRMTDIGLNFNRIPIQLLVALTGVAFGVAEYFILRGEAEAVRVVLQETQVLAGFLLLACTGFVEELIFRGVLQRSIAPLWGGGGLVYVSLLFASLHMIHNSLIDLAFVFVVAMFFAWVVKRTGSLLGVTLAHGVTNIMLYLVLPLFF